MNEAREDLTARYHRVLEHLWVEAAALHGCTGCALQDLESKLKATKEVQAEFHFGLGCAGICTDARAYAKPVFVIRELGENNGFPDGSFARLHKVSELLCEAWALGLDLMDCADCVEAAMLFDFRSAASQSRAMRAVQRAGSIPQACRCCHAMSMGLV